MHRVTPDHGDVRVKRLAFVMQAEANTVQAKTFNMVGPQIRFGRKPVKENPRLRLFFHLANPGIIKVQNGNAIRGQSLNQLALAAGNGFL